MLSRVKENFRAGIRKFRWFAELVNARLKVEMAYFKVMGDAEKLKRERDKLAALIGEKVFEERDRLSFFGKDQQTKELLARMEVLGQEIEELREKASQIVKGPGKDGP